MFFAILGSSDGEKEEWVRRGIRGSPVRVIGIRGIFYRSSGHSSLRSSLISRVSRYEWNRFFFFFCHSCFL